jgi:hypothetical protein
VNRIGNFGDSGDYPSSFLSSCNLWIRALSLSTSWKVIGSNCLELHSFIFIGGQLFLGGGSR